MRASCLLFKNNYRYFKITRIQKMLTFFFCFINYCDSIGLVSQYGHVQRLLVEKSIFLHSHYPPRERLLIANAPLNLGSNFDLAIDQGPEMPTLSADLHFFPQRYMKFPVIKVQLKLISHRELLVYFARVNVVPNLTVLELKMTSKCVFEIC